MFKNVWKGETQKTNINTKDVGKNEMRLEKTSMVKVNRYVSRVEYSIVRMGNAKYSA